MARETQQLRKGKRRKVQAPATLVVGEDIYYGTVLDLGSGGAFFRPERAVVAGGFTSLNESIADVARHSDIELAFDHTGRTRRAAGQVIWVGCSDEHFSHGIGVELSDTSTTATQSASA